MWPATGRVVQLLFQGLTEREIVGNTNKPSLLAELALGNTDRLLSATSKLVVDDYIEPALRGSFPEPALRLSPAVNATWFDAYLDHVVTRNVMRVGSVRDPVAFRRYVEVLALSTAGLPSSTTLFQAAHINQRTADAYDSVLQTCTYST